MKMLRYKSEDRYDPRTGKKVASIMVGDYSLCDYCGARIGDSELENIPTLSITEPECSEPSWYELKVPGHPEIAIELVFENDPHFIYCTDWDSGMSCSGKMLYASDPPETEIEIRHRPIWEIMYQARLKVVDKLLGRGMSKEELGLIELL